MRFVDLRTTSIGPRQTHRRRGLNIRLPAGVFVAPVDSVHIVYCRITQVAIPHEHFCPGSQSVRSRTGPLLLVRAPKNGKSDGMVDVTIPSQGPITISEK